MSLALAVFIKRPQADAQIGVEDNIRHSNMYVNLMLWLNQRHALKAFQASVGNCRLLLRSGSKLAHVIPFPFLPRPFPSIALRIKRN